MSRSFLAFSAVAVLLTASALPVRAQEQSFPLTIKDHRFDPAEIEVPANTKVKLMVKNEDATPEEFESSKLHREKVVPGGKEISIIIGPLKPGRYEFVGDFNRATAHGAVIVK